MQRATSARRFIARCVMPAMLLSIALENCTTFSPSGSEGSVALTELTWPGSTPLCAGGEGNREREGKRHMNSPLARRFGVCGRASTVGRPSMKSG